MVQSSEAAVVAEDAVVLAPVAAEHNTQSSLQQLAGEAVADQSDNVAVETLDALSSPCVGQVVSHSAAVDDLCVHSREVCRHHHNELLPSNE